MSTKTNHAAYAAAAADPAVLAKIEGRLVRPGEPGGCWSWAGGHTGGGRAQVWAHGRHLYVYRVLWVAAHPGETPDELDHAVCGNGAGGCMNPGHLRPATRAENGQHLRGARADNASSGVRGVTWDRWARKWKAQVKLGRDRHLGYYTDMADAERAARVGRHLGMPFSEEDKDVTRAEVNAAYRAATPTVRRHFDELAEIGAAAFVSVHRVPA